MQEVGATTRAKFGSNTTNHVLKNGSLDGALEDGLPFGNLDFDVLVTLATARAKFEPVAYLLDEFFGRLVACQCNYLD